MKSEHKGTPKEVQKQNEAKAQVLFEEGYSLNEATEKLGLGRATIARYRKKWRESKELQVVEAVNSLSPQLVLEMADRVRKDNPQMAQDLTHLSGGLDSLEKLQPQLHRTVGTLLTRCDEGMNQEGVKPSDFRMYAELALKAYATMQNTSGITFNMQTQNNTVVNNAVKQRLDGLLSGIVDVEEIE